MRKVGDKKLNSDHKACTFDGSSGEARALENDRIRGKPKKIQ
eukprot:CAMPEP_0178384122 /NCGR_PEP_ID=MMETSP0689_2-20121128/7354_1 /TAXON_ID=160604 /ORGANISM="Amphidinium massartii, Strain CS-259" /LENGTH=41 /DNA_ID= /DNA_START= /DNA_END= /DNA_ORIENTATION=